MPKDLFIVSLGGSIIVPNEIDWQYIKKFKALIERQIKKGRRFIFIIGGGKVCRRYQAAAAKVTKLQPQDIDWLGIHSTRLNAHLMRTVFHRHAHPRINTDPHELADFYDFKEPILIAAGWRPGFSTDYDAVMLAKNFKVKRVANLSNIDYVFDKDPKVFSDAKKIEKITWSAFRQIVGRRWRPGMSAPFDPIASKIAEASDKEVAILNGWNLKNLEKYLDGREFIGTLISGKKDE